MKVSRLVLLLVTLITIAGCGPQKQESKKGLQGELIIFHAGSLSIPIKALADSFNVLNPDLKIKPEAAGSLSCIRLITDVKRPCDILASADYLLIDKLMIPEYASWNLKFAVNEMAIVYSPQSKDKDKITTKNWPSILQQDNIRIGRSDPNSDPCGYRTVIALKLAEKITGKTNLAQDLLAKDNEFIRPKEVDLLALLETNTVDYIFLYKSVAEQHHLPYLTLSDSINLGNPKLANWYETVSIQIPGNSPKEMITQTGEAMVYGITIPKNAPNKEAAEAFIKFIENEGQNIIKACYQTPITPPQFTEKSIVPQWLQSR